VAVPKALITGITGQDGSYLAEYLIGEGYDVHGTIRTTSRDTGAFTRIAHLLGEPPQVTLHVGDLGDPYSMHRLLEQIEPDEVYNLAAQSHVKASFDLAVYTADVTGVGALRVLEAIRDVNRSIRFYQASSSEMFGSSPPPQNEQTPFHPRSPYAVAKVFAYWATVHYREAYGIDASNGILFNHESPRRGKEFVTRKITSGLAQLLAGEIDHIALGNLDARRDWGHARDFVRAMHAIVRHDGPLDLVIGTGVNHSVRDFLETAFRLVGRDWHDHVRTDPAFLRPADVDDLLADATRAEQAIGWKPSIGFADLVREMVTVDLEAAGLDPASIIQDA
jgi:GDPmannose 4,6-dehydratase